METNIDFEGFFNNYDVITHKLFKLTQFVVNHLNYNLSGSWSSIWEFRYYKNEDKIMTGYNTEGYWNFQIKIKPSDMNKSFNELIENDLIEILNKYDKYVTIKEYKKNGNK